MFARPYFGSAYWPAPYWASVAGEGEEPEAPPPAPPPPPAGPEGNSFVYASVRDDQRNSVRDVTTNPQDFNNNG
jgi:hypothetical protein